MNKKLVVIIAVLMALLLGVAVVVEAVLILPTQYDELYLGEMADKYARLRSFDGENKVIIIGGSSVAFGIKTPIMEKELDTNVVNFGLYGPLGTTIMLDLTRGHIQEGDIVILCPETDEQTMTMTFNGEGFWNCADSDYSLLTKVRAHNWGEMLGSFWTYAEKKYQFYLYGKPEPDGVYDHEAFDEYGDISFYREKPVMDEWYDPEVLIDLDPSILSQDFIDYVNEYIDYCESKGATVYWSWPPMNSLAVLQDTRGILEYATFIRENIHCRIISDITDYLMEPGYFYDTNYHVTDRGAEAHTYHLIQDLENILGDGELVLPELQAPPSSLEPGASAEPGGMPMPKGRNEGNVPTGMRPPEITMETAETEAQTEETESVVEPTATPSPTPAPTPEPEGSSKNADCFTYEAYDEGLLLTGTTDAGKAKATLEVPWKIDGQKVIAIGENTFDGCSSLKSIYIQSNIERIMQGAFDGAPKLTDIHLDNPDGDSILIPGTGLFDNVTPRAKVYVAKSAYGSYIADYFWGNYLDRIVAE